MSAKNTVFGTAVQYQREKFDPSLRLQRTPDTSQQAMQPFKEEAAAIQTQALVEEPFFELQDQLDQIELAGADRDPTFLQQLAPFSPLIKQQVEQFAQRRDERRKKEVDKIVGEMQRDLLRGQDVSEVTDITNDLMQRAKKSGQLGLLHNLSKLDWAQQAAVAEAFVKTGAKNYDTSLETFKSTVGPVTNDAEAQTLILQHDKQYQNYLESIGAPPEMYQSWVAQTGASRQKALNKLIKNNRQLQGEEIRANALNAIYGGASFLKMERRMMLSNKDDKRTFGKASTHVEMLKWFDKAIKAGDFNQKDIDRFKAEIHPITKKPIGESVDYQYFFGQLQLSLDKRKQEDAATFDSNKEKEANAVMGETLRKIRTGELNISDELVRTLRNRAFEEGIDSPRFNKMLDYIEDGLTVEDKAVEFLETELKTRLAQGEVIDDFEMLKYGQDLFNQYQSANEINKKNQAFQARKDLFKEGAAWLQQDDAQPEGGGGLDITTKDSVKTQGQIRLLNEWQGLLKQKFDQVLATAKPEDDVYRTGTVNGQSVKDTALALAIQDFQKLKTDPNSVFYKDKKTGTFTNTLKIKTNTGFVGTDAANKTYTEVNSKINTIQELAKSTNQDYRSIVTNEALLSQVISKDEAIKMKSNIEKGKGIPAAILAIAALGGDGQLLTAQRIFNTHELGNIEIPARNQQLAERLADPQFLSNFNVDDFMKELGDIHRQGPREQQRTKDRILKRAAAAEGIDPPGVDRVAYVAAQQITPEARALLRTLMWAEGTDKQGSKAYGTHYGYEYTPPTGNHPDRVITKDGLSSAAYGAYQFMPQTWAGTSFGRQGMPMTPENQDLAALELVRQRLVNPDKELTTQDWDRLTPEWASIPHSTTNRGIYAGQRGKTLVDLNSVYKQFLREERYNQRIRGLI